VLNIAAQGFSGPLPVRAHSSSTALSLSLLLKHAYSLSLSFCLSLYLPNDISLVFHCISLQSNFGSTWSAVTEVKINNNKFNQTIPVRTLFVYCTTAE
jgi:hypothetical protein